MIVHVDIKKIINKNKNIFEKMSGYVGFLPPPTYFLHIRCDQHVVSQVRLAKGSVQQCTVNDSPLYCATLQAGVIDLGLCTDFPPCYF